MTDSYISAFSSAKWEDWCDSWVITKTNANDCLELPTERPLSDRSTWKAKPSLPAELDPVLNRVKNLERGGLTSMMVLGDFLRCHIAPLQQGSRMACMYTGPNDCCRIARGPGTDFTRAELEASIRAMTGEAFSLESLVLLRGIKALCKDQTTWSAVLASMPTLDEGGLAVWQVGGDPNRGIHIPGVSPDCQQRTSQGPGGPSHGGPDPAGRGKGKEPELERRHKQSAGATPARRDDETRGAATAWSSQEEGSRSRRLQHGDDSYVGEPTPKRQKMAEAEGQSSSWALPPPPQQQQPQEIPPPPPTTRRPATLPPPPSEPGPQVPSPPPGAPSVEGPHQRTGESSAGKEIPPIAQGGWEWFDFV
jgi:hypothetical protein